MLWTNGPRWQRHSKRKTYRSQSNATAQKNAAATHVCHLVLAREHDIKHINGANSKTRKGEFVDNWLKSDVQMEIKQSLHANTLQQKKKKERDETHRND